ncbi:MAG: DUF4351 domain-containing protein [Chromatiaceae bacterium]|jgi:hypothetical protein|nr:DUF4351 domain-containing protein [Chromatiaceae bacterium]
MEREPAPERRLKYLDFIDIYADLDENERIIYRQRYPEEDRAVTRFAERFVEQGLQQGVRQGEAEMLLRLLGRRFGEVPDEVRQRVETADAETLLQWSERLLTARSLEDVLH